MIAAPALLGVAAVLLALGVAGRFAPVGLVVRGVCLVGAVLALVAGDGTAWAGLPVAVDGVSRVMVGALFLAAAVGGVRGLSSAPAVTGALAGAMLAGNAWGLVLGLLGAVVVAGWPPRWPSRWAGGVAGVAVAAVALGVMPAGMVRDGLVLAGVMGAACVLPFVVPGGAGGLAALYVVARVLLGWAGPVTPGWWGVAVLVAACAGAAFGARRLAGAVTLGAAVEGGRLAAQGLAGLGFGVALLARGADLQSLAATAVAGALLQVLALAVWGGLLALCSDAIEAAAGSGEMARLGGLLRRMPGTGQAMGVALASLAAVPVSAGFGGMWLVLQGVLGAGRAGGIGAVLLVTGVVAALGFVWALLAAGAVRVAGVVLLGPARTARGAGAAEPRRAVRLGMAGLGGLAVTLGVCPALGMWLVQPGVLVLAGVAAEGGGWLVLGGDGLGYASVAVAALLGVGVAGAGWAAGMPAMGQAWQGGFAEEGVGHGNMWPVVGRWRLGLVDWGRAGLAVLALGLAVVVGWVAR